MFKSRIFVFTFLAFLVLARLSWAEEFFTHGDKDFQLHVTTLSPAGDPAPTIELRLIALNGRSINSSYSAFTLVNPTRLIIDIPGLSCAEKLSAHVSRHQLSSIRAANFAGYLRVTLEFAGNPEPKYSISRISSQELRLTFTLSTQVEYTASVLKPQVSGDEVIQAADTQQPQVSGKASAIKTVLFKAIGIPPRGAVMFDISGVPQYKLNKEEDNRYRLLIDNTKLGADHLLLPQYAPENISGLDIVLLQEVGNNIAATIYTRGNVELAPYIANNRLWIKAVPR